MGKPAKLFESGLIGQMEVKNRIIMAPMATGRYGPEGELTDQIAEYYAARAKGGVGLIICQSSIIMWESRAPFRCSIYDDKFILGFRRVADAIHSHGAKAAFQLIHHGRVLTDYQHMVTCSEDIRPVGPSAVSRLLMTGTSESKNQKAETPWARGNVVPPAATEDDIRRITRGFAEAARRVKEAGFDSVEVMGGHGYLLGQFLSPLINRRTDAYGGSTANRARFACEVIEAIRKKVGPEFPILFRLSGSDFLPGGISVEQVVHQVPLFVEAGVDALHISAGEPASSDRQYPSYIFPQGVHVFLAEAVKKVSPVPVITAGKIYDPVFAEQILEQGKADFIALGRPLLADPDWPIKAKEGRSDEIRACIYCLNCLHFTAHPHLLKDGITCSVNPAVLREKEFTPTPTASPKKVMVIGGGPAGMEAARTLAERGHQVDLYEQDARLGGQWHIASEQVQKKEDYSRLLRYLKRGLERAGVRVRLNVQVTLTLVEEVSPDAAVVATGALPISLNVPGADGGNVVLGNDVIIGAAQVGRQVVIVGGRNLGMELADQLAGTGRKVSLVTRRELGRDIERNIYLTLRNRLLEKGVYVYPCSPVVEIQNNGIYIAYNNDLVFLPADTIILAIGFKSQNNLVKTIKTIVPEVYSIGDCIEARDVMYAIREAAEIARKI